MSGEQDRVRPQLVRWSVVGTLVALVLGIGAAGGWAVSAVFSPPRDVLTQTPYTYVELTEGEVGSSIRLNTVASWQQSPAGYNQAVGTVTSVAAGAGDEVHAGSVLYSVDLRPVTAGAGSVPAFRSLSRGLEGADVQQLQAFLLELGFYSGPPDGKFGAGVEQAVKSWQRSIGVAADGVVQASDLIFLPSLPARVLIDPTSVFPGAKLVGGEPTVAALPAEPTFHIPATVAQSAMMPAGTRVDITAPDGSIWPALVSGQTPDPENSEQINVTLTGPDQAICAASCTSVAVTGQTIMSSNVITQEPAAGVIVPSAALLTSPDGTVSLIDEDRQLHTVTVVASARGMSALEGVEAGLRVQIPATSAASDGSK